jgi:two-component system OmpR family response regulator/two-component system response regulator RstA
MRTQERPEPPGAGAPASILIVEDDTDLAHAVSDYLRKHGFATLVEPRGDAALERIRMEQPDLVILDVMLPGRDGFSICRDLRAHGDRTPVMMLTARDEDFDEVLGLEIGADDYVTKPVEPRVLVAHVKAMLRRAAGGSAAATEEIELVFGRLRIHGINREVTLGTERIELSPAEFDLLWMLASHAGKVLHRNDILKSLRGLSYNGADRSVDARLYRLRRRFGDEKWAASRIKSIRPQGYMFSTEPW